jgi:hypothetical protein
MKEHKATAVPVLLYGSEAWTVKKEAVVRNRKTEMKFLRYVKKGCTIMDNIRYEQRRKELQIF